MGTATGPANLEADWTANTINLEWYNEDTKLTVPTTSNTCTYDGGITLPSTNPTKTGYTFRGWQVRASASAQTAFDLSTLDKNPDGNWYAFHDSTDECFYYNNITDDEEDDCSGTHLAGLSASEWKTGYYDWTVKGTSYCSGKSGSSHDLQWGGNSSDWSASENELISAEGEKKYCWCKPTGVDNGDTGNFSPVAASWWVYRVSYRNTGECASTCAYDCALVAMNNPNFRAALFGQVQ